MHYMRALLLSVKIFAKGAPRIIHGQVDAYYRCLIELEDLAPMHALADIDGFRQKDFLQLLGGHEISHAPAAIDDAKDDVPAIGDDAIPVEDIVDDLMELPSEAVVSSIPPYLELHGRKVHFTNYKSASGVQRCWIKCGRTEEHGMRCIKTVQIPDFDNYKHAASWLIAWELGGKKCTTKKDHLDWDVPDELVQRIRALLE